MRRYGLRRRRAAAGLIIATASAGAVALAPVIAAPGGVPAREYLRGYEPPALAGHLHDRAAFARRDAARLARCEDPVVRAAERGRCPALRRGRTTAARTGEASVLAEPGAAALAVDTDGRWGDPFALPVIGINTVVLATGKVLMFAYPTADLTRNEATAYVWDPATRTSRRVDPPLNPATGKPFNIWCAGQAVLADGRVLVAGGNLEYPANGLDYKGLKALFTFDPFTETWTRQPDMAHGRWYPTVTTLPDGRAVIHNGYDEQGLFRINQDVEVFTPSADPNGVGTLSLKPTARRYTELYPHMFVVPGGKVLQVGPDQTAALLDTNSWTWQGLPIPPTDRVWGSAVLMPAGPGGPTRLMMIGGTDLPESEQAMASSIVLDLANPGAGWSPGPSMGYGRSHHNTVLLPDESLLTVGGGSRRDDDFGLWAGPVYQSEILDPGAGSWRGVVSQVEERTYHSTAVLLPDGRVLAAGDDRPGARFADNGELYEPPYLFRGARPTIDFAPTAVRYGAGFRVATGTPSAITRAVLVRAGSTTHANDMDQRSIRLALTTQADGLTLSSPADATLAPPGYYMLFLLDGDGVPSAARMLRLDPNAPDAPPLPGGTNAPPSAAFTQVPAAPTTADTVVFTDTSTDSDGTIVSRGWDLDDDGAFDDGGAVTAGRTFPAGSHAVRLRVTDDDGAASTATRTVTVSMAPGANLLPNPSFEAGTSGWFNYRSTITRQVVAGAPDGAAVARVARATGADYSIDDDPDTVLSATAGHRYEARAVVRAGAGSSVGKTVRIVIRERRPNNVVAAQTIATTTLTNTFTPVTVTATVGATGNRIDMYVMQLAAGANNAFQVDAMSLRRL